MTRKPVIGITSGLNDTGYYQMICREFMNALVHCGALPVLLPLSSDEAVLRSYIDALDGFIFSGGGDIDPLLFGQLPHPACGQITPVRDDHELLLMRLLIEEGHKPVLGICRGFQVMNVGLGGDIYQDLPAEYPGDVIAHRQKKPETYPSHPVTIQPGSRLHEIAGSDSILVNSLHHQALKNLGHGFHATAHAPDGVIEAAELEGERFFVGIQWHPERLWMTDLKSEAIFGAFVRACTPE